MSVIESLCRWPHSGNGIQRVINHLSDRLGWDIRLLKCSQSQCWMVEGWNKPFHFIRRVYRTPWRTGANAVFSSHHKYLQTVPWSSYDTLCSFWSFHVNVANTFLWSSKWWIKHFTVCTILWFEFLFQIKFVACLLSLHNENYIFWLLRAAVKSCHLQTGRLVVRFQQDTVAAPSW